MTARSANKDLAILLVNRLLRAFAFGGAAILITFQLEARGMNAVAIGLVLSVALGAASVSGLLSAAASGRWGRRRVLTLTGILMAASGLDVAFAPGGWLLGAAALTGMLAAGAMDIGPFLSLEQAMLSETAQPSRRNRAFGRYSLTGALAFSAGAAAAGLLSAPGRSAGFFVLYAVIGGVTAVLPALLSDRVESPVEAPAFGNVRPLLGLAGLFALDALGGGFTVQSVLVYWLHVRFGASAELLGPAFSGAAILNAFSYELSGRIADRIGRINTMVFTHLPSNLLLLAVPLAPSLPLAVGLLLARATISSMDVPTRQAYVVSMVKPAERAGAVAVTGALRGVAMACGPVLTGLAIQSAALALPLILGGGLKITYDVALYFGFRRRRAEHELAVAPATRSG